MIADPKTGYRLVMNLFSIITNSFGLTDNTADQGSVPLKLSSTAHRELRKLSEGQALRVHTVSSDQGFVLRAEIGAGEDGPLLVSDEDAERLRGLMLDVTDGRWRLQVDLNLRSEATPNPNSRLFRTNRTLLSGPPLFALEGSDAPPLLQKLLAIEQVSAVLARDRTLTLSRTDSTPWLHIEQALRSALTEYFLSGGKALVNDAPPKDTTGLFAQVQQVLIEQILPAVHSDGGNIELVEVRDRVAYVHLEGACQKCPAAGLTLGGLVNRTLLEAFPSELDKVQAI